MTVPKYTIEPGRNIYRNGRPYIAIMRCGDTLPTEADDAARAITLLLQRDRDVELLYQALTPVDYDRINRPTA
jgi:hypothetical protein